MTSFNFEVKTQIHDTTTRPNGESARKKLSAELARVDRVVVDMTDIVLTPSFADEFLGVLLVELGEDKFRRSVDIVNLSSAARLLLRTVLGRRAAKPEPPLPPRAAMHA